MTLFGLGNPGPRYRGTRHNAGFLVLDRLAAEHGRRWRSPSRHYQLAEVTHHGARMVLVKPETYMNLSGTAVLELARHTPFERDNLLIVADDINLPLGQLRLRRRGGDGGHNGLKSIISALEDSGFPRLRLGVGPVPGEVDAADYVLGRFTAGEGPVVERQLTRAVECIWDIVGKGFDHAMNVHNPAD
ncbi:MAG: aminoacyl-tRNA hydrolase [Candidatus Krumholzibacteriia bacterium]